MNLQYSPRTRRRLEMPKVNPLEVYLKAHGMYYEAKDNLDICRTIFPEETENDAAADTAFNVTAMVESQGKKNHGDRETTARPNPEEVKVKAEKVEKAKFEQREKHHEMVPDPRHAPKTLQYLRERYPRLDVTVTVEIE